MKIVAKIPVGKEVLLEENADNVIVTMDGSGNDSNVTNGIEVSIHTPTGKKVILRVVDKNENNNKEKDKMQVLVKNLSGKTRTIRLKPTDAIIKLKVKIYDLEGIPPSEQRLIFAGKPLKDDRTLSTYNIGHGSSVQLYLRLR